MAAADNDIEKTLSQLIEKLSQTDQFLSQLEQECDAEGFQASEKKEAVQQLNASQLDSKEVFYDLLEPFYETDDADIHYLDLSELQEWIFRVIETKGKDEFAPLTEVLEGVKQRTDETNERIVELMRDLNIEPTFCEVKDMYDRKRPFHLTDLAQEACEEKSEPVQEKDGGALTVSDVAIHMYGFAADIAADIKESLWCRKLINNEKLIDRDEAAMKSDKKHSHKDELKEKDPVELSWVRVKGLKQKFEELKKKLYPKQEPDVNDEGKVLAGAAVGDPSGLKATLLKVIRHWVFHIESVLFYFVMHELYYMLAGIEAAETIFEDYNAKLNSLMEISHGRVPIIVYKITHMMEYPTGLELNEDGVAIRTPSVRGSGRETLHEKIELNDVMEQIHNIILRLNSVLATSSLFSTHFVREDESDAFGKMLEDAEDEVREIQRKIYWEKSKITANTPAG